MRVLVFGSNQLGTGLLDAYQVDSKLELLLDRLHELVVRDPSTKVIIFTQFRDSQEYITRHLDSIWHLGVFHGQLKSAEKDEVIDRFRDVPGPAILISTEAGGEGRNFQFCHMLGPGDHSSAASRSGLVPEARVVRCC